jgi:hypothetical protein
MEPAGSTPTTDGNPESQEDHGMMPLPHQEQPKKPYDYDSGLSVISTRTNKEGRLVEDTI